MGNLNRRIKIAIFPAALAAILACASTTTAQNWSQLYEFLAHDASPDDYLGSSIAIGENVIAVGAPGYDGQSVNYGAVYLYSLGTGELIDKIVAEDRTKNDWFGDSVVIGDGLVVIGSPEDDDLGDNSGSAYVFDLATRIQIRKLLPDDGTAGDQFGQSVDVSDGIIAVGTSLKSDHGYGSGAVYLFDAATGAQLRKLQPTEPKSNDYFGFSLEISDGLIVVGAPQALSGSRGSAYVFDVATGAQLVKLVSSDGHPGDCFGESVSIYNGVVAVGASSHDSAGEYSGAAYLFDASTGTQTMKLKPPELSSFDSLGESIDLDDGTVVVGAPGYADSQGVAFLFDVTTGLMQSKIGAIGGETNDSFGWAIDFDDGVVGAGAPFSDRNVNSAGSAHVLIDMPNCLNLDIGPLVPGQETTFTITGGTPGAKAITVYGFEYGETVFANVGGYCATFQIAGVTPAQVVGGTDQTFDQQGKIEFNIPIPPNAGGPTLFFQSAQQGTCLLECMTEVFPPPWAL
jgi:WD40 repeat protein